MLLIRRSLLVRSLESESSCGISDAKVDLDNLVKTLGSETLVFVLRPKDKQLNRLASSIVVIARVRNESYTGGLAMVNNPSKDDFQEDKSNDYTVPIPNTLGSANNHKLLR